MQIVEIVYTKRCEKMREDAINSDPSSSRPGRIYWLPATTVLQRTSASQMFSITSFVFLLPGIGEQAKASRGEPVSKGGTGGESPSRFKIMRATDILLQKITDTRARKNCVCVYACMCVCIINSLSCLNEKKWKCVRVLPGTLWILWCAPSGI